MKIGKRNKNIINDFLLISGLLILSCFLLLLQYLLKKPGAYVYVTVEGEQVGSYPLTEEKQIPIHTERGYNLLVIADHKASIQEADCPDGLCASSHPISRQGESLICLPHQLVVTVENAEDGVVDAEVY